MKYKDYKEYTQWLENNLMEIKKNYQNMNKSNNKIIIQGSKDYSIILEIEFNNSRIEKIE